MAQNEVNFLDEERDYYSTFTRAAAAGYRFFNMFRVELGDGTPYSTVAFGKSYEDDEVERAVAKQLKLYIKEQKKLLRENPKGFSATEIQKKIFTVLSALIEHAVFCPSQQSKIMTYASFAYTETKEDE